MQGFSKTLKKRFKTKWVKPTANMVGGNLGNKRREVVKTLPKNLNKSKRKKKD